MLPAISSCSSPAPSDKHAALPSQSIGERSVPEPPPGVIRNGYGEYLIYRMAEGTKKPISQEEFEVVFDLIEECRTINSPLDDRHQFLESKIQEKLGDGVHLAFVPRTLYELIYLQQCIQEDIANKNCCNAREQFAFFGHLPPGIAEEWEKKTRECCFWQLCEFDDEDYGDTFAPQNLAYFTHLKKIAGRLNVVALDLFKNSFEKDGFTFEAFEKIYHTLIPFFTQLSEPSSAFCEKVKKVKKSNFTVSVAKHFSEETTKVWGGTDQHPLGIVNARHEQIVKKAIQLECSQEAGKSVLLYRGGKFESDVLVIEKEGKKVANCVCLGTGLFAGAIYDGGATPFHYMRQSQLDAQVWMLPRDKLQSGSLPFHAYHVHPLAQLLSAGEYFHGRTKLWSMEPEAIVLRFYGAAKVRYERIRQICKSQMSKEDIEAKFKECKDKAFILASKETAQAL